MGNPFRRIWQAPGEAVERALRPSLGLRGAFMTKWMVGKLGWGLVALWATAYYGVYCSGDWTTQGGWKYHTSKPATMPYEESYPKKIPNGKGERLGSTMTRVSAKMKFPWPPPPHN